RRDARAAGGDALPRALRIGGRARRGHRSRHGGGGGRMRMPLYRRVLGPGFDALPARVRELHDLTGPSLWHGRAAVERGRSLPARLAALLTGLPPEGPDQPLQVAFEPVGAAEVWSRKFGASLFRTVQEARGPWLCERA